MKIAVRSKGGEIKYVSADEIEVGGMTLAKLFNRAAQIEAAYNKLTKHLEKCIIVDADKTYLIEIDEQLHRVDRLKLYDDIRNDVPLQFYTIENGRITLDKKKVGVLI